MEPFLVTTPTIALTELRRDDAAAVAEYCSEPVFEPFMSTPWPYTLADAAAFVGEYAPTAWRQGSEWTWAIRDEAVGPLLGVIGLRLPSGMLGYWLGAPHRGRQIMSVAVSAVAAVAFERTDLERVSWEAHIGNVASLRTVQRSGFAYTGEAPSAILGRDGKTVPCWTAELVRPGASPSTAHAQAWPV